MVNYPSLLNNYKCSSEQKLPTECIEEYPNQPVVSIKLKPLTSEKSTDKDETHNDIVVNSTIFNDKEAQKNVKKQDSKGERREWLKKQLSVNYHYFNNLRLPKNSIMHRNAMLNISKYRLRASSCPNIYKNSMITINEKEEVSNT